MDPTMAPMQLSSNCDVEILSGADFDQLKSQLEEYHEARQECLHNGGERAIGLRLWDPWRLHSRVNVPVV